MRIRRDRARPVRRVARVGHRADDHVRPPQVSRPAPGVLRPVDLGRDLRHARPGHQLGPRDVPMDIPATARPASLNASLAASGRPSGFPESLYVEGQIIASTTCPSTSRSRSRVQWVCLTSSLRPPLGGFGVRPSSLAASCGMEDLEIHFDPTTDQRGPAPTSRATSVPS
jgi:hypothetical protein